MNYVNIIPLAGGMTFANMEETGKKPEAIISWDAFYNNDSHLIRHIDAKDRYHVINRGKIDYKSIIEGASGIDFVSMVPPCAGLSLLNASHSRTGKSRGSDAEQNDWMYESINEALKFNPKVIWGENAPGLYGNTGKGVVDNFRKIASENGYSLSLYKTDTTLHGIPQNRTRTYFFLWKAEEAPIMNWYNTPHPTLESYLAEVPKDSMYYNTYAKNHKLDTDPFYLWIKDYIGEDYRKIKREMKHKTVLQYVFGDKSEYVDRYDSLVKFIKDNISSKDPSLKKLEHIKSKIEAGKGFWDNSPVITLDTVNAVISKNMYNTLHPTEDRFINVSEYMHLMGLPLDYVLDKPASDTKTITQNVPVATTRDMTREVIEFIRGNRQPSGSQFLKQNNMNRTIEEKSSLIEKSKTSLF